MTESSFIMKLTNKSSDSQPLLNFEENITSTFENMESSGENIDPLLNFTFDEFSDKDEVCVDIKDIVYLNENQLIYIENFVKSQKELVQKIVRSYSPGRNGTDIKNNNAKLLLEYPGCITSRFLYGYRSIISYCSIDGNIYHWEEYLGEPDEGTFEVHVV